MFHPFFAQVWLHLHKLHNKLLLYWVCTNLHKLHNKWILYRISPLIFTSCIAVYVPPLVCTSCTTVHVPPLICTSCITVWVPPLVCTGLTSSAQVSYHFTEFTPHVHNFDAISTKLHNKWYCTEFTPHLLKWILHPESHLQFAWPCTNKCSSSTWLCNIF